MKLSHFTSALLLAGMAAPAFAQEAEPEHVIEETVILEPAVQSVLKPMVTTVVFDGEEERLKRDILREVDKRIAKQLDTLRRDIRQMLSQRGERPNHAAPRTPQPPRAPQPPMLPQTSRRWITELDGPRSRTLRVESRTDSRDGQAKIRIEVNGKVIEKVIPLGQSFELELPGGRVWVKTDGRSGGHAGAQQPAKSSKSERTAQFKLRKHDGNKSEKFDFDFDFRGDRDEMRRKLERLREEHGGMFEGHGPDFGAHLPELHRQIERLLQDLEPDVRREMEGALKQLHGALRGAHGDQPKSSDRRRPTFDDRDQDKKSKKRKRQTEEEESF